MSNPTSNYGWQMPTATDLVTDLPADFEVFGQAVDTAMADLLGGTTGQILAKNSNTNMDFVWTTPNPGDITGVTAGTGISGGGTSGAVTITNSMATEITAKGDLIVGTGNAAFDNLPAGTNGHVLTADSTVSPTGLKWAAAVGGKVLQVIQDTLVNEISTTSGTLADTGLTVTITPSSASSKVLVIANMNGVGKTSAADTAVELRLLRDSTTLINTERNSYSGQTGLAVGSCTFAYLDSPATTSATTYKIQYCSLQGGSTSVINTYQGVNDSTSTIIVFEIGA